MVKIHSTAECSKKAKIGNKTIIWNQVQIREGVIIGEGCILGKNVYIDTNVVLGKNVKVENNVSIYQGVTIEDGVFIGPHVCFTNDKIPRAINPDSTVKKAVDWNMELTTVGSGSSIGANSTILPGIRIGNFSIIGAGSVVTKSVPDHGLVFGNPAKLKGYVCYCGLKKYKNNKNKTCEKCKQSYK